MTHNQERDNNTERDTAMIDNNKIAEFMGKVTAELQNGNRLMEQLRLGQEALKLDISEIRKDIEVMKASTDLKRRQCDKNFEEHEERLEGLDDKVRRDKIMLDEIERKQSAAAIAASTTKEVKEEIKEDSKDKRDITAWQMGLILGALQIASFIIMVWWKK